MAGIKILDKNYITINYIINELLKPDLRKNLFDDAWGMSEISTILYDMRTIIYGVFEKGRPEPIGIVFFTNTVPYRDCNLYGCIFDAENRKKGKMNEIYERIKADLKIRYLVNSVSACVIGNNSGSAAMLEKMKFKKVGKKKNAIFTDGKYQDLTMYYYLFSDEEKKEEIKEKTKEEQNGR